MKRHTAILLFLLVFATGAILAPKIGVAWDEPDNIFSAGVFVNYFTNGFNPKYFSDRTDKASAFGSFIIPNDHSPARYPPVPNYAGLLVAGFGRLLGYASSAAGLITAWHIATAFFLAILVATTYRFGRLLGLSQGMSVVAALFVFLYPQTFGHGLSNSKDTAQAAMVTVALYYLVKNRLVTGGILFGLGLATKFNAIYVPVIWALSRGISGIRGVKGRIQEFLIVFMVGVATFIVVWPFLWTDTAARLKEMAAYFLTVGRGYPVLWNGTLYTVGVGKSLWWYPWASLLVTTPLLLLALMILGGIKGIRGIKGRTRILFIWFLVPLVRTIWPWSAFYDQLRHFLEIIPALALLAAFGLSWIAERFPRVAAVVSVAAIGQLMFIAVVYFPYNTGYYNALAASPNVNFDRDVEGLSVKEGIDWARKTYGRLRLFVPVAAHLSWYYLTPSDSYEFSLARADTVVLINKQSHRIDTQYLEFERAKKEFSLVYTIRRGNAVFGWVYRRVSSSNVFALK